MLRQVSMLFCLLLWLECQFTATRPPCKITFCIRPQNLPANSQLYLTGNQPELKKWYPNRLPLEQQANGSWTRTLIFKTGAQLEFKITRGAWDTEAVDANGLEYPNFQHLVQQDTTLVIRLENWRDQVRRNVVLSAQRMKNKADRIELFEDWKFHPGDDSRWAQPEYDDQNWVVVNSQLGRDQQTTKQWTGIGWFRLHLQVDSSLWHKPLAFNFRQAGAAEVFLNGKRLYKYGQVGQSPATEAPRLNPAPQMLLFDRAPAQVLAIRYSNFKLKWFHEHGLNGGFISLITNLPDEIPQYGAAIRNATIFQMVFSTIPIALAFLHLLFFFFYPPAKQNLWFAICMLGFATMIFCDFQKAFATNWAAILQLQQIIIVTLVLAVVCGLITVYISTSARIPKHGWFFVFFGSILIIGHFFYAQILTKYFYYGFLAVSAIELLRLTFWPDTRIQRARWVLGFGFITLFLSIIYQILIGLGWVLSIGSNQTVYIYGILVLSIAVSIDLAQNFAKTHRVLEHQLQQVKVLAEKALLQERRAKEEEIARRLLEADNARKTLELEAARELQLSMLPKVIPTMPQLEIGVYMKTASEVGGDYYDFYLSDEGVLTIAIGDATGHGTKAGIMVALIKSIFNTMAHSFYMPDFFHHSSKVIQNMNLGTLYMALALLRIKNYQLTIAAAGMPPILIYRRQQQAVEEILIKGLPLGSRLPFTYHQQRLELEVGDTILLMSDGFMELFNPQFEQFDLPRIKELFQSVASLPSTRIIEQLTAAAETWRNGQPQNDDITFVVVKVKA
ncbi:SpoIIE family protein phosphatase [candidate division KSB1 bacterium]|nr:SpoIIE family protein phosphatase [candidate division KSB1 bacterium]